MNKYTIKRALKLTITGVLAISLTFTFPNIAAAEKGKCTDEHTKEWCNSHGYENNRPVQHKVKLTGKQKDCYWTLVSRGVLTTVGVIATQDYVLVPFYMLDAINACS